MKHKILPSEQELLHDELEEEFRRWMSRLPCYMNTHGAYKGFDMCINKYRDSASVIVQKYVLQSEGKLE